MCPAYCHAGRRIRSSSRRRISGSEYQAYGNVVSTSGNLVVESSQRHRRVRARAPAVVAGPDRAARGLPRSVRLDAARLVPWRGARSRERESRRSSGLRAPRSARTTSSSSSAGSGSSRSGESTLSYSVTLRAEMVSMLAKYIPGGIWTPAARVVAARRAGVTDASARGCRRCCSRPGSRPSRA